jgi:hypothetical protein
VITSLPANMQNKIRLDECRVPGIDPFCWTWTGAATGEGYGSVGHQGRTCSTHRLAYTLIVGPIPPALTIDHLCVNILCCNPAHMEPVTRLENIRRGGISRYAPALPPPPPSDVLMQIFEQYFGRAS